MRAATCIIAFALLLTGGSIAGTTGKLPNAGMFVFNDTPISSDAPLVVAGR